MENINIKTDKEVSDLLKDLTSENGVDRKNAREKLVKKGPAVIDHLKEYVDHQKHTYRWEALKTMEEIGDSTAIPLFIKALDDDESDIRWIAAEGLIKTGKKSVIPLLKHLTIKKHSVFVLSGTHHVFYDLSKNNKLPSNFPTEKFLSLLKRPESDEAIKLLAFELLNDLEF